MAQPKGLIAAGDPQTARAGAVILQQGGNAVDAVVAAAFVSFVAEAVLVNICGGGMATIHMAHSGENITFDFFADMPRGTFTPEQSDFKKIVIDFGDAQQPFFVGRASGAVPGVVAGLCRLAAEYGTLPLETLLQPAIALAENGVSLSPAQGYVAHLLRDIFTDTPHVAAIFAPHGDIVRTGDMIQNVPLARTLRSLSKHGADEFYRGELAEKIVADQQANGGLISLADLQAYQVKKNSPISVTYRGHTILLPSTASVGGVLIAFTLKLLAHIDLPAFAVDSLFRYRALAEAFRLTNVARQDLRLDDAGIAAFLQPAHVASYTTKLQTILQNTAVPPHEPIFSPGSRDTTHISVMDAAGNIASVTTSAGESAGYFVADTGMLMNNILGEIDLHPNGFHTAPPGSRLQTMMSPAIVLRDGAPVLALGSGGSTRIRSAIVQVLSNVLDFGMPLDVAVAYPRLHFEAGVLQMEGGAPPKIVGSLQKLGYRVNRWHGKNMYFGGVHAVGALHRDWRAVGDSRRGGSAVAVDIPVTSTAQ